MWERERERVVKSKTVHTQETLESILDQNGSKYQLPTQIKGNGKWKIKKISINIHHRYMKDAKTKKQILLRAATKQSLWMWNKYKVKDIITGFQQQRKLYIDC